MRRLVWTLVGVGALVCALVGASTASAAGGPQSHTCSGGNIAAGTYASLRVTGFCMLPNSGTVRVLGNVTIASGAALNAITPATFTVGGNIRIGSGAILGLGCAPEAGCAVTTNDRVGGNLTANGAAAVIVHNTTFGGNLSLSGGGGSTDCSSTALFGGPFFSDIEDSHIGGNASVSGLKSCWFGFIRNHVGGNVTVHNNTFGDEDATEIVTNVIHGNLSCSGNNPAAQVGDSAGAPNVVFGRKTGECASL